MANEAEERLTQLQGSDPFPWQRDDTDIRDSDGHLVLGAFGLDHAVNSANACRTMPNPAEAIPALIEAAQRNWIDCPRCDGEGESLAEGLTCPKCRGTGSVLRPEAVRALRLAGVEVK